MTARPSELTWYSRLAVWVGAVMLLMQSITGRGFGVMTVLAVILLAGGLLVLVSGLALDARAESVPGAADRAEPAPEAVEASGEEIEEAPAAEASEPAPARAAEASLPPAEAATAAPVAAEPARPGATADRVPTVVVGEDSPELGAACPFCGQTIRVRQLAARCPACGAAQHANCWTENYFHCATPDCSGHGSLEAPQAP